MKKLSIILFAVFTVFSGFSQTNPYSGVAVEISYNDFSSNQKKVFTEAGNANPYNTFINLTDSIKNADVLGLFKVTDIPKSRKMITDTTVTPNVKMPEFSTQFMLLYKIEGQNDPGVIVTTNIPKDRSAASLTAIINSGGLKQGDDEFGSDTNSNSTIQVGDTYSINDEDEW